MSKHTNDVVARTILIPGFFLGLMAFGAYYGVQKFEVKNAAKVQAYKEHQGRLAQITSDKKELEPLAPKFQEWKNFAFNDTRASVDATLRRLKRELDPKKIILTEGRDDVTSPFGAKKDFGLLKVRTYTQKWEGTFKELQKMLIRQEERKPFLHLVSMNLKPSSTGLLENQALSLDLTFAAWEGGFRINNNYMGDTIIAREVPEPSEGQPTDQENLEEAPTK